MNEPRPIRVKGPVGIFPRGKPSEDFQVVIGFLIATGAVAIEADRQGYAPDQDVIVVKDRSTYPNEREFLIAVLHELAHWAGAKVGNYPDYRAFEDEKEEDIANAREEIVAESAGLMMMRLLEVYDKQLERGSADYCSYQVEKLISLGEVVPPADTPEMKQWLRENFGDEIKKRVAYLGEIADQGRRNLAAQATISLKPALPPNYNPQRREGRKGKKDQRN